MKQIHYGLQLEEYLRVEDNQSLINLIECTKAFLNASHPLFKDDRQPGIKDSKIEASLNAVAAAFQKFEDLKLTDEHSQRVFSDCKEAISQRLDDLDQDDRISLYFKIEGNATNLKKFISPQLIDPHTQKKSSSPGL